MWILNWLPDLVFHLILIAGVLLLLASWIFKFIPFVSTYQLPLQVIGVVLTVLGVWYEGGIAKDNEWKVRVAALEVKVAQAEAKSAQENVKIVTKVVTKIQQVRTRGNDIIQYIDREIVKYDNICPIPPEVVKAHNMAAERVSDLTK